MGRWGQYRPSGSPLGLLPQRPRSARATIGPYDSGERRMGSSDAAVGRGMPMTGGFGRWSSRSIDAAGKRRPRSRDENAAIALASGSASNSNNVRRSVSIVSRSATSAITRMPLGTTAPGPPRRSVRWVRARRTGRGRARGAPRMSPFSTPYRATHLSERGRARHAGHASVPPLQALALNLRLTGPLGYVRN
jgi:hypothetical protein